MKGAAKIISARWTTAAKPSFRCNRSLFVTKEIDPKGAPQFGLLAEQVDEINPLLWFTTKKAIPIPFYDAINSMLLNEFLKEHNAFVEAQHKIDRLETTVASLVTTLKKQAAQIQKVSAQVELSKAALPTLLNDP